MTDPERVKLLDAAMRSRSPVAYLQGVHGAFEDAGQIVDALTAAAIAALYGSGEIESLMLLRAEWTGRRSPVHPRARSM